MILNMSRLEEFHHGETRGTLIPRILAQLRSRYIPLVQTRLDYFELEIFRKMIMMKK